MYRRTLPSASNRHSPIRFLMSVSIFPDRVALIPSLRCRHRLDHFLLRNWQTTSPMHAASSSSSSLATHISTSILFLWSSRGTQSAVKHPSLKMTLEFLFFRIWPPLPLVCQSCLCAVPRSQSPGFGVLCNFFFQCTRFFRNAIYE